VLIETMKTLKVYDITHRDVKAEAAKTGRTVPNMADALLSAAVSLFRAGKLKLPAVPTKEGTTAGK
jgi:hypothetical protein